MKFIAPGSVSQMTDCTKLVARCFLNQAPARAAKRFSELGHIFFWGGLYVEIVMHFKVHRMWTRIRTT